MIDGLVTVVLPIYNVEPYLNRCIQSVVNQSYTNLEILLIDDGSPDNCPKVCDEWALKDMRIRVIHKKNEGLGMARNTGIDNATGEYICFFDSDDYVSPTVIEESYTLAKKDNSDLVVFGLYNVNSKGDVVSQRIPNNCKDLYVGSEVVNEFLPDYIAANPHKKEPRRFYMSSCTLLFSMQLIQRSHWRFVSEREIIAEDIYSLTALFSSVDKISILQKSLYYYCENSSSLSRKFNPKRIEQNSHFYLECLRLCEMKGYNDDIMHRLSRHYVVFMIAALKQGFFVSTSFKQVLQLIKKISNDEIFQNVLRQNKKDVIPLSQKILFFTIRNRFYLLCAVILMIKYRHIRFKLFD